jgi:hypothetical protein
MPRAGCVSAWGRWKPRTGVECSARRMRGWLAAWGGGAVPVRTAESAECGRAAPPRRCGKGRAEGGWGKPTAVLRVDG